MHLSAPMFGYGVVDRLVRCGAPVCPYVCTPFIFYLLLMPCAMYLCYHVFVLCCIKLLHCYVALCSFFSHGVCFSMVSLVLVAI